MDTIKKSDEHIMPTYGRYGVVLEKGSGCCVKDENGKEYIDFGSGIGTNSLGFCDKDWADAVCKQVQNLQHASNYYYTKPSADFAEKLCEMTGYKKLFFANSGAEANECAIKLARKYSFDKYGEGRGKILTLKNSFHGRTLTTLTATGQDVFHNYFFPFPDGFDYVEAGNADDLIAKLDDTVCAVMFECVQGEGGVVALDREFVNMIFSECQKRDVLTICDEVQTGSGRTGKFLASEYYGVKPNVTTLAKGVAGGLPIGVCLADDKCKDVLSKGMHGSTFGGNPVCCAAGCEVLSKLSAPGFLDEVCKKADYMRGKLAKLSCVSELTGLGLMIGMVLKNKTAVDVCKECLDAGLLVLTAKDRLRLLPPLTITYDEIDRGLEILGKILN